MVISLKESVLLEDGMKKNQGSVRADMKYCGRQWALWYKSWNNPVSLGLE